MAQVENTMQEQQIKKTSNPWNLLVKQHNGMSCVRLDQVEYAAYKERVLTFVLNDGRTVRTRSLKEPFSKIVEMVFQDARFSRPHESYMVNMEFINTITASDFEMKCGARVPISKRVYKRVREEFVAYMVDGCESRII